MMYQSMTEKSRNTENPVSAKAHMDQILKTHMDQILKTNLPFYIVLFKEILL